ncbi:hypothetical protein [Noviherbaspirillum sp.]|uniref:hypothetical protein n=1 Tax=Noviherbaspirillum sp. TaxID=1926288 RepID=UPI002D67D786|nr:hypothetical protein [Noviherbaspirillum sp.]HZW23365.1 hypothetical protein [Noviherbaspirillum sp.]
MRKVLVLTTLLALCAGSAVAKLPPQSPEAAAAAAAAKDKAAWTEKVAAYKLCLSQDRVAQQYRKTKEGAPKQTVETPPCTDPGPYTPSAAAAPAAPAAGSAAAAPQAAPAAAAAAPAPAAAAAAPKK